MLKWQKSMNFAAVFSAEKNRKIISKSINVVSNNIIVSITHPAILGVIEATDACDFVI